MDKEYVIHDEILCWKNTLYVRQQLRKRITDSEHDSKVAQYFAPERTMELITRNFYWPNMENVVRKYSNECENCHRINSPRLAKYGLLHPLEMACMPSTHTSRDIIPDQPELEEATLISVVVN